MALLKPFSTIQHQEGRKRRQVGEVWGEGGGGVYQVKTVQALGDGSVQLISILPPELSTVHI